MTIRTSAAYDLTSDACAGAALARLEARIAISALIERSPALDLADEKPTWISSMMLRGATSLPVTV